MTAPVPCSDCDHFVVGDAPHLRLRLVCPSCNKPLHLNNRYECVRQLSGTWGANAEVFTVTDRQDPNVQKILKVLTNQESYVLKLFKIEQLILMDLDHPGIPKGYEAFDVKAPTGQVIPCIIMERIEGDTLQNHLNHNGSIDQATAIEWMTQLLHILDYAHSQKLFHRDIKPTNIMRRSDGRLVLIDFGTARHITQTIVNGGNNTVIYSHGYTAPEQMSGKAEIRSDFYALGRTFLHLLMGELPSDWKTFVSKQPISPLFQTVLQNLTKQNVSDRPKSTKIILKELKRIKNEPKRKRLKDLALTFSGGTLFGIAILVPLVNTFKPVQGSPPLLEACGADIPDKMNCGTKILIPALEDNRNQPRSKTEAVRNMKAELYGEAERLFKESFNEQQDPETLIYLNNARIHNDPKLNSRKSTIAIIAPTGGQTNQAATRTLALLRGAAQAQTEAIEQLKIGLEIVIVNDDNKSEGAEEAAGMIAGRNIVGGVGHTSSDALKGALSVYEKNEFVVIAPTATSEDFNRSASGRNHVLFRTLPPDSSNAKQMVNLISKLQQKKIAIYFTPGSSYSESLRGELIKSAIEQGIAWIQNDSKLELKKENFDANIALEYARSKQATVHVLIPSAAVTDDNYSLVNAEALVFANRGQDWIVAGDSLSGDVRYQQGELAIASEGRMLFSSPWDVSADPNSPLMSFWKDTPFSKSRKVDWRTFTTYNATWMMATALHNLRTRSQLITRVSLREELSRNDFKAVTPDGRNLNFVKNSGEIDRPRIVVSTVKKCGDIFTTVNFDTPICPTPKTSP